MEWNLIHLFYAEPNHFLFQSSFSIWSCVHLLNRKTRIIDIYYIWPAMKTRKDLKEFPLSWKRIFLSQQGHLIFQKDFAHYDNQGNLCRMKSTSNTHQESKKSKEKKRGTYLYSSSSFSDSKDLVRMRENTDQKNSEYGLFSGSAYSAM